MNAITPGFGCTTGAVSFEAALERVLGLMPGTLPLEQVGLLDCLGRIIAEPFLARSDLPRFDHSAMDGYAVCGVDLTAGAWLPVTGRFAAGTAPGSIRPGCAHRILTGAPLPKDADAVIAQENVRRHGRLIGIGQVPAAGTNVRRQGEDMRCGQPLIVAGTTLDWRHIAVLAAQGVSTVAVRRRPRITLLSNGRELRSPGQELASEQIYDSNLPMLVMLLRASGAAVRPMAIVADDAAAMQAALRSAAHEADLVITTGGISVGDEDHVREALRDLGGDLAVLSVAMKPGKPLAAGRIGDAVFIGLPGNPIAALAGAIAFVRPLLARMTGTASVAPIRAHAGFDIHHAPDRTEFMPIRLSQHGACLWAQRVGPDGSGRLAPLLNASGFAVLGTQEADISHGTLLDVLPFMPTAIEANWETSILMQVPQNAPWNCGQMGSRDS